MIPGLSNLLQAFTPQIAGALGTDSLATRGAEERAKNRAARNARIRERKGKLPAQSAQTPAGVLSAQDLIQLFQAMPVPNRGFRNPNASKPHVMGQGMAWLDEQNTPEKVAARQARANAEAAQRRAQADQAGSAAVDYVKQTKGYTDAEGNFVPPTIPLEPSSKYGSGSIKYYQPGEARPAATTTDPLTGKQVPLRSFLDDLNNVQMTKYGPGLDENGNLKSGPSAAQAGQDYFNPKGSEFSAPKPTTAATTIPSAPKATSQADAEFEALFANAPKAPPVQMQMGQMPKFSSKGMLTPTYPDAEPYVPGPLLDPREVLKNFLNQFAPKSPVTPSHLRGKEPFSFPPML